MTLLLALFIAMMLDPIRWVFMALIGYGVHRFALPTWQSLLLVFIGAAIFAGVLGNMMSRPPISMMMSALVQFIMGAVVLWAFNRRRRAKADAVN